MVHGQAHRRTLAEKLGNSARCRSTESTGLRGQSGGREKTKSGDESARSMDSDGRRLQDDGGKRKFLSLQCQDRAGLAGDRGRGVSIVPQRLDVKEVGVELEHGLLPGRDLGARGHHADAARRRRSRRWPEIQKDTSPALPYCVGNVQVPADCVEESRLVLVDLLGVQTRDLAPGASRVVSVLEVLGRENERGKEDAAAALQGTRSLVVPRLFHCEVELRNMVLDEN